MKSELENIAMAYGNVCVATKQKQRRKRQKLLVIDLLLDYAKNSSLHGLRYLVENGLNIIEKLFWLATVIASIVICSICINKMYQKWITSPVIVTINGHLASVASVPFPAVTICPQVKVKSTVYNYTEAKEKYLNQDLNADAILEFLHIGSSCEGRFGYSLYPTRLTNVSFVQDMTKVAPEIHDIFFRCAWYNTSRMNCKDLFSKVYTADGVCYTANSLAAQDIFKEGIQTDYRYMDSNHPRAGWTPEDGYDNNIKYTDSYPRRGRVLGFEPDMQLTIDYPKKIQDEDCNNKYTGYKIYLQHPADFPQGSFYSYAARPNEVASVAISFHKFDTDSNLISYPTKLRQCYFQKERPLRYFKIYSAKNCQAECLSNFTLGYCGCVGYYMPHNDSTQICSPSEWSCINNAKDLMALQEITSDLGPNEKVCNCLPACNTVEYDAEILKSEYNKKKVFTYWDYLSGDYPRNSTHSKINFFFKQPQFVTMQRTELFGVTDLLANIGGLLGVFLGFSFLSLIEIFYFLTLRVGFTLKRDLEEETLQKVSIS